MDQEYYPEDFSLRLVQTIVTYTLFNAFPQDKSRPLTREEADEVLIKILIDFYYINYKTTIIGLLGLTVADYSIMATVTDIKKKVKELNMSFVYLNVLVAEYFSPILLAQ